MTKLSEEPAFFKLLATHEMIHAHTRRSWILLEVDNLPPYPKNAPEAWFEGNVPGNDALESVINYLSIKTLRLLDRKPIYDQKACHLADVYNAALIKLSSNLRGSPLTLSFWSF